MLTRKKVFSSLILIAGIIILLNLIANRFFLRLDFTADQRYSLSEATKSILSSLDAPITVKAYFSENLPPDIAKVKQDFKDLLIEYNNRSDRKIEYEFINPNESQETEVEAQREGISPIMINVRERDQMKQQRAYLGAVLKYADKTERIPLLQPGSAMEYDLTTAIKKLTLTQKPKIAFLQGNGEPGLDELSQLIAQLSILYDVQSFSFNDTATISPDINSLIIIAPKDSVAPKYLKQLDDYYNSGGRILLALNSVEGDFSTAQGKAVNTNLIDWIGKKGITIEPDFLIDISATDVMVRQQQGGLVFNTAIKFPYIPIITNFNDHPITKGIEAVAMPFVSKINIQPKDSAFHSFVLATTSKKTGIENPPLHFSVDRQWKVTDFPLANIPVAVAAEYTLSNGKEGKLVVFSDGDFAVNGKGQNAQRLQPDNVNLMSNAIDWISDDTGLISLRTKGVTSRPIDASIEDGTKTLLKYLNFLLPIFIIIGYGIFRYQRRKYLRKKWASQNYVQ